MTNGQQYEVCERLDEAMSKGLGWSVLQRLRALVELETPSRDVEASVAITRLLGSWWDEIGAKVEVVPTQFGHNLLVEVSGEGDPVLLVGHSDTVWPVGTLTGDVPWSIEGDVLRGPGAYDMKSGLVIMLAAATRLKRLREAGGSHRGIRVVVVCDEEIGSPSTRELMLRAAEGVSAVLGFESPHPDAALKVGRRGSTRVRLAVTGRAAHAALDPESGISAIDELVDQLQKVRGIVADPALGTEVLCNVGTISGGGRANVVPAYAEAEIGLRFLDTATETAVLDGLKQLTPIRDGAALDVEILSSRPAWAPHEADNALLTDLREAATAVGQELDGRPAAGAGDTNLLGSLGLPTADGLGPSGGGAHAVSEHLSVESLGQRIDLLESYLTVR
ncbi:M20/M25/M40 family metallo-hydrolase [Galactobacter sp.]|uniref:M20/M25/M40 family metallo-hydrolase n=1 Tax=Galactobacter sp. TaxID=2676125 RepID=UPI0025BAF62D|nr:M20/M25/M40 family metallo-hydrolase [Galactobacter sp.]